MVVNDEDECLLVKSWRGWEFPGGFVEDDEAIKDAAIREVKEESGITIELQNFLGMEQHIAKSTCVFLYKGKPVGGRLTSSNETEDVGYFPLEKAMNMIKVEHFKERIIRCLHDEIPSIITI